VGRRNNLQSEADSNSRWLNIGEHVNLCQRIQERIYVLSSIAIRRPTEYDSAFSAIVQGRADGVLVLATPLFISGAQPLADLALMHKLPSVFTPRENVEAGGLMSYSPNRVDYYRRGAIYVDKILKGANPADLPVQQPTRFQLVLNLKTAKALGLTIPESFLSRVDEVIE